MGNLYARKKVEVALCLASSQGIVLPHSTPRAAPATTTACSSRRDALLGALAACTAAAGVRPASAFDNAVPDYANYADKAKRKGNPPKDLGVLKRTINADSINADPLTYNGLRKCDGKPNCFSTTGDELLEDRILTGVDTLIKPWKPPAGDAAPFKSLKAAVKAYTPGQGFIDGGGFQVVKESDTYLYLNFEALKKGYIDDLEFALRDGMIDVRSSSRVGQTDFAVNAKRLNYIAAALRKDGWTIEEINPKSHPDYWDAANEGLDLTFDKDRRRGTDLEGEGKRLDRPNIG